MFERNAPGTDVIPTANEEVFRISNYMMLVGYSGQKYWGQIINTFIQNEEFIATVDRQETFRVSIRLFSLEENEDDQTDLVYPIVLPAMLTSRRDFLGV